jgi:hypothetical protein
MVVIVDLDDEAPDLAKVKPLHHSLAVEADERGDQTAERAAGPNPNFDNGFSAALSCYP